MNRIFDRSGTSAKPLSLVVTPTLFWRANRLQMVKHAAVEVPDIHEIGRYRAGFPWCPQADWMVAASSELLGKSVSPAESKTLVQQSYRPDLYQEIARYQDYPTPDKDSKPEGVHSDSWCFEDGIIFGGDLRL